MRKLAFIALLVMLTISGAALAQSTPAVFCGTLSQADCDILTNAHNASQSLDSVSYTLNVNATVTNAPNMPQPVMVNLTGNGAVSGLNAVHGMMAMAQTDPGQFLVNALDNLDSDMSLTVTVPPELMQNSGSGMPNTLTLQTRLVDGFGYINFDTLQPIMHNPNLTGWGGVDLASLVKAALQQNPDLFKDMQMGGMSSAAMMQQFEDPAFLSQFVTIRRTDTGTGDTATFTTTVDLAALSKSPQFQTMMTQQMQNQGTTMTDEEMQQGMAMSQMMFQGMSITVDQEIGISDGFTHSIHGTINFDSTNMMATMMMTATPSAGAAANQPAPIINVDFTITFSNFNNAPAITAPTNVTILPWQSLLGIESEATAEATDMMMTPTNTPTNEMTAEPTGEVTSEPTGEVTSEPTAEVTTAPTVQPTAEGTTEPTAEVTTNP